MKAERRVDERRKRAPKIVPEPVYAKCPGCGREWNLNVLKTCHGCGQSLLPRPVVEVANG